MVEALIILGVLAAVGWLWWRRYMRPPKSLGAVLIIVQMGSNSTRSFPWGYTVVLPDGTKIRKTYAASTRLGARYLAIAACRREGRRGEIRRVFDPEKRVTE